MAKQTYDYVIVGSGLAGTGAVEGIRAVDRRGSILLVGREKDLPYDRPPLSKQLWTGAKKVEEIFLHDQAFYDQNRVELQLGVQVTGIDPDGHTVTNGSGAVFGYRRLLLATGGSPRHLEIPGGNLPGISYFRTLEDFRTLRRAATPGRTALVIGGGLIGSEMAAALCGNQVAVTMVFPGAYLVSRVFPEPLGRYLTDYYRGKGVTILTEDVPTAIERNGAQFLTRTRSGRELRTDLIVAGVGIAPDIALAKAAGLATGDGVIVGEYLQTSDPDIFAAGDIACFPDAVFGPRRIEHWDNAVAQGKHAGGNMAGKHEPFTYLPFFFSDLFEFGYEAVGQVDSRLETLADWQEENKTGAVYYLADGQVRGAMMCNVWGKVEVARELITAGKRMSPDDLRGRIR